MQKRAVVKAMRLMRIWELLQERAYTTRELARQCAVAQRTIQRDLADLQSEPLRKPLICDEQWRWEVFDAHTG